MVGVHFDGIIFPGGKNACDEVFDDKQQGELKMYTGRDWDGVLEVKQTAFVKPLISQYRISAVLDIPASPGVCLGP